MKKNWALFTVLLIIFVDVLGFTIMIPLLPFYAESLGASPFVVGLLSSIYGFCSLIAGPVLGDLSDRYGRRIVLLLSQMGTFTGFIILALSNTLWVVFLARFIDGVTSGNMVVAQAYISDVTEPQNRTKAMGLIGAAFGLGFIVGPAISGLLSQYGHTAPIWASAALSFLSIVGTTFFLKDVSIKKVAVGSGSGAIAQVKKYFVMFKQKGLTEYFIVFFFFSISFTIYMTGLALYCERMLTYKGQPFSAKEVGLLLSYVGIISFFIQVWGIGYIVQKFGEIKVMLMGFLATTVAFLVIGSTSILAVFIMGMTINTFGTSIIRPAITGILSKNADPKEQGLVFGLNQTLMAISQIICPLLAGYLIGQDWNLMWCLSISFFSFLGFIFGRHATKHHMQKI